MFSIFYRILLRSKCL